MARFPGYAPQYRLRIDGDEIPPALRGSVISIKHESDLDKADRVGVSIANQGYRWLDHPLLQPDNRFELSFGYAPDPLEIVFTGEIIAVAPDFPFTGMPTIQIDAQDMLNRLTRNRKDKGFHKSIPFVGNLPLPDIAVIQTALSELQAEIDPVGGALSLLTTLATYLLAPQAGQEGVRLQESQSDFEFLTEIAQDNGWKMFIDHAADPRGFVLRFKSLVEDFTPSLTLKAGASIIDFEPRVTSIGDVAGISARIWVDFLKMEFVIVLGWDFDRSAFDIKIIPGALGSIEDILGGSSGGSTIDIKPAGFATSVQQLFSELLPRLNNRLTGSGTAIGDPRIRPGELIAIEGVGAQFGGLYRINSAKHTFDNNGYETSFKVNKEAWFGTMPLPAGIEGRTRALGPLAA